MILSMTIENDIKHISQTIRRCQRNWDKSKQVPREHIELLAEVGKTAPTKQDEAYYDIYVVTDDKLIEKLYETSGGYTAFHNNKFEVYPNSQTRGNLVFCWTTRRPTTMRNYYQDDIDLEQDTAFASNLTDVDKTPGTPKDPKEWSRDIENTYTSIGISMACVAQAAARLGYVTGFNKNTGDFDEIANLPQDDEKNEHLRYTMTIGFPLNREQWYLDEEGREFSRYSETERENSVIEVTEDDNGNIVHKSML